MNTQGLQNIDALVQKIHQEGVDKANKDAETIINKAEASANEKIEEAEAKANAIIEKAKEEASQMKQHTISEVQVAASKLIDNLHQQVADLFQDHLLADLKALDQKDQLFEVLQSIIAKWDPADIDNVAVDQSEEADVKKSLEKMLPALIDKTVTSQDVRPGVVLVRVKDGFQLEISKETLINELKPYLSAGIQEILFKNG